MPNNKAGSVLADVFVQVGNANFCAALLESLVDVARVVGVESIFQHYSSPNELNYFKIGCVDVILRPHIMNTLKIDKLFIYERARLCGL